ncbi:MAG: succinylglutamate desuccinylase/aspartoacylase family protein [Betaproteobacteria bacterium]
MAAPHLATPSIDVRFPDLARWERGNAGVPYAWRWSAAIPGPHVVVQALTHGNEVCGAIALDRLLHEGFRPACGTLTLVFANVDAYRAFDHADPYASRCVDEDYNRLWSAEVLDGPRRSRDLARARELRPVIDRADALLDLHSMTDPCPPLALAGPRDKGLALARAVGVPRHIVIDAGHAAGRRLRDYAFFDDPADPRAALLIECGQHWERAAPEVALDCTLRFLAHFGMLAQADVEARLGPHRPAAQRAIRVTDVVTIASDRFVFAMPVHGLLVVPKAGTLLATDDGRELRTPHDDCVLIMPTRRPKIGETAVRLGQFVD